MSVGDLVATMGIDVSGFTRSLDLAMSGLNDMASQCTAALVGIETSVDPAAAAMKAIDDATLGVTDASKQVIVINNQTAMSYKDLAGIAAATAAGQIAAAGAIAAAHLAVNAAVGATRFAYNHAAEIAGAALASGALWKYAGVVNSVARWVIPQYRMIGMAVGAGLLAYNVATSEAGQETAAMTVEAARATQEFQSWSIQTRAVARHFDELKQAGGGLGDALTRPFADMAQVAATSIGTLVGSNLQSWVEGSASALLGFEVTTKDVDDALKSGTKSIKDWSNWISVTQDTMTAAILIQQQYGSATAEQAQRIYDEAAALREQAAASAKSIEAITSRATSYKMLSATQDAASQAAKNAAEVQELGMIKTAEAVEEARTKYQQLFSTMINGLKAGDSLSESQQKHMAAIFSALESQSAAIQAGRVKPDEQKTEKNPAEGMLASLNQEIARMKLGEQEAALAAFAAADATEAQIDAARVLLEEKSALKEMDKAAQEAARAQEASQKAIESANKKAEDQIAALTRRYAELTGEMTKAQAAQADALQSGASAELAQQVADAMEKVNAAELGKKFAEQVQGLHDQLDLATGELSKGELAARKALKEGATDEEADEIQRLTDLLDSDKGGKGGTSGGSENRIALAGSAEASQIVLHSIGDNNNQNRKLENYADKQVNYLAEIARNFKNLEPAPVARDIG